jgi:hypothetical protein
MSDAEYVKVKRNQGALTLKETGGPGRELFVTQNLNYVASKSISDTTDYGVMVKWIMRPGTVAALLSKGGIDNSIFDNIPVLRNLPHINEGDPDQVHIKFERGAITYGLRRNTVGLFNQRIMRFRKIGYGGASYP